MPLTHILFGDPRSPLLLQQDFTAYLARSSTVERVLLFGSLARGEWDRWSDVDLIVVTAARSRFTDTIEVIHAYKQILHHNPFEPHAQLGGGHLLGVIFTDQSPLQNVDVNFFSLTELESPDALARFGKVQEIYNAGRAVIGAEEELIYSAPERPDDLPIRNGIHFVKKAAKKLMRGQGTKADLQRYTDTLKSVLASYPDGIVVPEGDVYRLAEMYVEIADSLLNEA
jgi:hypothetical protein